MASKPAASTAASSARFLTRAAAEAERGMRRGDGGPFGAAIVRRGRVLALGHNTVLAAKDPTCHAEMNALRQAARKLKRFSLDDCDVYSTTEPCPMCFSAIHWARARRVVYSTTIADVKKLGFNELTVSNRRLKRWGKSHVELKRSANAACKQLLENWKRLSGKKVY